MRNWTAVGNWIWTPSSTVVNEFRFGYDRDTQDLYPWRPKRHRRWQGLPPSTRVAGGFPNLSTLRGSLQRWQLRQLAWPSPGQWPQPVLRFSGQCLVFAGQARLQVRRRVHAHRGRFQRPRHAGPLRFQRRQTLPLRGSTPLEDFFAGTSLGGSFAPNQLVGNAIPHDDMDVDAGFVQDDWRITPRLMLNLGLRYAYASPIKEVNNLLGNFDPNAGIGSAGSIVGRRYSVEARLQDFSPRVGFAWDVTGKGTTVVRGGASIIYSTFVATLFLATGRPAERQGRQRCRRPDRRQTSVVNGVTASGDAARSRSAPSFSSQLKSTGMLPLAALVLFRPARPLAPTPARAPSRRSTRISKPPTS